LTFFAKKQNEKILIILNVKNVFDDVFMVSSSFFIAFYSKLKIKK